MTKSMLNIKKVYDMGIFNSNDYKRGYDDGYNDALKGKDPDYIKSGASLKFVIHGNKALDTYNEGYKEGYRIGSRDRVRNQ